LAAIDDPDKRLGVLLYVAKCAACIGSMQSLLRGEYCKGSALLVAPGFPLLLALTSIALSGILSNLLKGSVRKRDTAYSDVHHLAQNVGVPVADCWPTAA
jgi:hypothetical protein